MNKEDAKASNKDATATKRILLLQGPVGPFFSTLQKELIASGYETTHVIFNFADLAFSSRSNLLIYRNTEKAWPDWVRSVIEERQIDLIILFGCERERHVAATKIANEMSIPVLSLEEGYVRPGYITAEIGGNNRWSPLRHLTAEQLQQKPSGPVPLPVKGHAFNKMAWFGFYYYILRVLGLPFFAKSTHHKNRPVISEAFYWARNFYRKVTRKTENFQQIETLLDRYRGMFYIVPLQVRDDMQLVRAGRGWNNETLIEKTIISFAKHAPKKRLLVFKVHPLERGHSKAKEQIAQLAKKHGCERRVICLDDGSIGLLTRDSAGMLTINSTSAFSAMLRNIPLGVIGEAMFRNDEVVHCIDDEADLDDFWRRDKTKKLKLAQSFRNYMRRQALISGDYYFPKNRIVAAKNIRSYIENLTDDEDPSQSKNSS